MIVFRYKSFNENYGFTNYISDSLKTAVKYDSDVVAMRSGQRLAEAIKGNGSIGSALKHTITDQFTAPIKGNREFGQHYQKFRNNLV